MINCDCRNIKYNQRELNLPTAKGNVQLGIRPPSTASSMTHQLFPGSPEAMLRLCVFLWELSSCTPFWEEERWVPFAFRHISPGLVSASTLLHTLASWCTYIFNPAHFSEIQGSRRLQETHNWFSSTLTPGP